MFTIKKSDLNPPGISPFLGKISNFNGFKGKTARRVSKLVDNIVGHSNDMITECNNNAEKLGGKLVKGKWEFKELEKEKEHFKFREAILKETAEVNCNPLVYEADVKPHEEALKFTPLDYGILKPFVIDMPED